MKTSDLTLEWCLLKGQRPSELSNLDIQSRTQRILAVLDIYSGNVGWSPYMLCSSVWRAQPASQNRILNSANSAGQQGTGVSLLLSFAALGIEHADCLSVLADTEPAEGARKLWFSWKWEDVWLRMFIVHYSLEWIVYFIKICASLWKNQSCLVSGYLLCDAWLLRDCQTEKKWIPSWKMAKGRPGQLAWWWPVVFHGWGYNMALFSPFVAHSSHVKSLNS